MAAKKNADEAANWKRKHAAEIKAQITKADSRKKTDWAAEIKADAASMAAKARAKNPPGKPATHAPPVKVQGTLKPESSQLWAQRVSATAKRPEGSSHSTKVKFHVGEAASRSASNTRTARTQAIDHLNAASRANVMKSAASRVQGAGKKVAQHSLQKGKRGGTFYLSEGKKVYAKK